MNDNKKAEFLGLCNSGKDVHLKARGVDDAFEGLRFILDAMKINHFIVSDPKKTPELLDAIEKVFKRFKVIIIKDCLTGTHDDYVYKIINKVALMNTKVTKYEKRQVIVIGEGSLRGRGFKVIK